MLLSISTISLLGQSWLHYVVPDIFKLLFMAKEANKGQNTYGLVYKELFFKKSLAQKYIYFRKQKKEATLT